MEKSEGGLGGLGRGKQSERGREVSSDRCTCKEESFLLVPLRQRTVTCSSLDGVISCTLRDRN